MGRSGPGVGAGGQVLQRSVPGPPDGPHFAALAASAEELIAAIGLETGNHRSRRHLEFFQDFSSSRIDSPHVTFIAFPSAVPQLSVGERDDEVNTEDDDEPAQPETAGAVLAAIHREIAS